MTNHTEQAQVILPLDTDNRLLEGHITMNILRRMAKGDYFPATFSDTVKYIVQSDGGDVNG